MRGSFSDRSIARKLFGNLTLQEVTGIRQSFRSDLIEEYSLMELRP